MAREELIVLRIVFKSGHTEEVKVTEFSKAAGGMKWTSGQAGNRLFHLDYDEIAAVIVVR